MVGTAYLAEIAESHDPMNWHDRRPNLTRRRYGQTPGSVAWKLGDSFSEAEIYATLESLRDARLMVEWMSTF
jgi:hypothetical protein